jgi:hypothetical protein
MKKLFLLLSLVFLTNFLEAQVSETVSLYASNYFYQQVGTSPNLTYSTAATAIGKETINNTPYIYRSCFEFSLSSIPSNATITNVVVTLFNGKYGYTLKLTQVASLSPGDYRANWTSIGNSSTLHSGIQYNANSFPSTPVKSLIQNRLSSGNMYIGAASEAESTNGSNTSMSISLQVTYSRPAQQFTAYARNDMDGYYGGHIGVGVNTPTITDRTSPFQFTGIEAQTVYVAAYDYNNQNGGYSYVYNDSEGPNNKSQITKDNQTGSSDISYTSSGSYTFQKNDGTTYITAELRKVCNLSFQSSSTIYLDWQAQQGYSASASKVKENSLQAFASNYTDNGIDYTFQNWSSGENSYGTTITATAHATYTAIYSAKPNINNRSQSMSTNSLNQIILSWNEHPNQYVTEYHIYRRVGKTNPTISQIGTTYKGTTTFIDPDYINTGNMNDEWLMYDVRPYYSVNGTESDPHFESSAWGMIWVARNENIKSIEVSKEIPSEYSIGNYPNPFNPTTTINYQLPQDGMVTLKVYDVLGKEVATLVNEHKSAGYYQTEFEGGKLSSGIYVAAIQANNFTKSIKLLLAK